MEPKFQTSFIPKKPLGGSQPDIPSIRRPKSAGTNLFMALAVILFVASLAGIGGAYAWKQYLISSQSQYKQDLTEREKQFNITQINQLKQFNVQIDTAKQLLHQHLAMSELFRIISKFTIESIRFLTLDLTTAAATGEGLKMNMTGYGTNFSALAFQSTVLGSLEQYGLRNVVKNPIIANPIVEKEGTVAFGFSASVDPETLSYENIITATSTGI